MLEIIETIKIIIIAVEIIKAFIFLFFIGSYLDMRKEIKQMHEVFKKAKLIETTHEEEDQFQ